MIYYYNIYSFLGSTEDKRNAFTTKKYGYMSLVVSSHGEN